MKKPTKGKWGFLQGSCDRCGEDDLPLVAVGKEHVCDTCARVLDRVQKSKIQRKKIDKDDVFIKRFIAGG